MAKLKVLSALQYLATNALSEDVAHFYYSSGQHSQEMVLRASGAEQVAVAGHVAVTVCLWGQVEAKAVNLKVLSMLQYLP